MIINNSIVDKNSLKLLKKILIDFNTKYKIESQTKLLNNLSSVTNCIYFIYY